MPQPKLEPCEPPCDRELELLYQMRRFRPDKSSFVETWYQDAETGLIFRESENRWVIVSPVEVN